MKQTIQSTHNDRQPEACVACNRLYTYTPYQVPATCPPLLYHSSDQISTRISNSESPEALIKDDHTPHRLHSIPATSAYHAYAGSIRPSPQGRVSLHPTYHCLSTCLLTTSSIPKTATIALLVRQSASAPLSILDPACPLRMMTPFCPFLEVVETEEHERCIVLQGAGALSEAFRYLCNWIEACCNAKRKLPFSTPTENSYVRCSRIKDAATVLRFEEILHQCHLKMRDFERGQVHSDIITTVYAMQPPHVELRERVANSIALALWERRLNLRHLIEKRRKEIPGFDRDVNTVMDGFYEASAAKRVQRIEQSRR